MKFEISYYQDYIPEVLAKKLLAEATPVKGVDRLFEVGTSSGLESQGAMEFLRDLYLELKDNLKAVLKQRAEDRDFLDRRQKVGAEVLGLEDARGRTVFGPIRNDYAKAGGDPIAPIPDYLLGPHVTLFGPPDSAKMAINAMNAFHRKLKEEPPLVEELLSKYSSVPKWGADDEDSKTPLRKDLVDAAINLTGCFEKNISFEDKKKYELAKTHLSLPIKRFPGLALPSTFLFCEGNPIPLHLYDFALHIYKNWHLPQSLCFYVPKLENEEEAAYIHKMVATAEAWIKELHPEYVLGSVRLMIVLENPRAILRAHEIMDALHPYFVGASLGWHDYLGSTARLYKENPNYRIPVKADPDIVIKYIKASHLLLADVVGSRGGIKVGGMYGILPLDNDLFSASFQMTILGFIKDVITQMKRDLTGYWVAHPDFVRLGIALVEAWKLHAKGQSEILEGLVQSLLVKEHHKDILNFIHGPDIEGLDIDDPNYVKSLIVADIKESDFIPNNHPEEVRYNVFQSLQYLTDWLSGNGCVALPAIVNNVPVRVMDDLATAERSRWEVWHEIYHGRFSLLDFIRIAHEEMHFIRKDLSNDKKIVQVKYTEESAKWYPVAFRIMLKLMTDKVPPEFATELLMPFTVEKIRSGEWAPPEIDLEPEVERLNHYFEACGCNRFAAEMAKYPVMDLQKAKDIIMSFDTHEILQAAGFHGDIGEAKKTLDAMAAGEQAGVLGEEESVRDDLQALGEKYRRKFGFKFLVSAKGKSGKELLEILEKRYKGSEASELLTAKEALWEITRKRLELNPSDSILAEFPADKKINIAVLENGFIQEIHHNVELGHLFEPASLSKTLASAFCIEYFKKRNISLQTSVNQLLKDYKIPNGDKVTLEHLMSHQALNMHYVKGYPRKEGVPPIKELLGDVAVENEPGTKFSYSGGGFLVLQYLIEELEGKPIHKVCKDLPYLSFDHGPKGDRMDFPAFAAGALGTAKEMAEFLRDLSEAYEYLESPNWISHDTAVQMFYGKDLGSVEFIGAKVGLGTFVAEAGENKICLHQGANEGYRALYVNCFHGPDAGKGFVIFMEGDNEAVPLIGKIAQDLIKTLKLSGIDYSKFINSFDDSRVSQEQKVNLGYKAMVFDAFEPCLPGAIDGHSQRAELFQYNLCIGARIAYVSNEKFGRAENLISPYAPVFDPAEFCFQGKVMDSWETERHNLNEYHSLRLELPKESLVSYVLLSTQYHDGNHVEYVEIEGLLPKLKVEGHSQIKIKLPQAIKVKDIHLKAYPDGGLTRLGLFEEVPNPEEFDGKWKRFSEEIPKTLKPLSLQYEPTEIEVVRCSNEHYGRAAQVLSPTPPIHMHDGFESARSRDPSHMEELELKFKTPLSVKSVDLDFCHFRNNCPVAISLHGKFGGDWVELHEKTNVKAYAGNQKRFYLNTEEKFQNLLIRVYPDGGFNRVRINS